MRRTEELRETLEWVTAAMVTIDLDFGRGVAANWLRLYEHYREDSSILKVELLAGGIAQAWFAIDASEGIDEIERTCRCLGKVVDCEPCHALAGVREEFFLPGRGFAPVCFAR